LKQSPILKLSGVFMTLSICIPTYNRVNFLKKNVEIIISQIKQTRRFADIEICVSDNCSLDGTESIIQSFMKDNPDVIIKYQKNESNIGFDLNAVQVMRMARNEYSILWGDDDFFKDNALNYIFGMLKKNKDISLFFSNRTCIDGFGNYVKDDVFIRDDIKSLLVDFANEAEVRSYFYLSRTIACLFTYISSVIYKTSIVHEREFDKTYIGTAYAFLYFWWNHLMMGNKLLYTNISYVYCTIAAPSSFDIGLDRILLDYKSFTFIAGKIFSNSLLKSDFLKVINCSYSLGELRYQLLLDRKKFTNELIPYLKQCEWNPDALEILNNYFSIKYHVREIIKQIMPKWSIRLYKKIRTAKNYRKISSQSEQ
jgi:abequosyltransferase